MSAVPKGWKKSRLGEVATEIAYGFTTSSTLDGREPKLLRITDIQQGKVNWDTVPRCRDAPGRAYQLDDGDIVIARTGATTGKSFLIDTVPEKAVFASYLIRVRLADPFDPRYVWAFMQTNDYWSQIKVVSKGTAQPGANATILSGIEIPIAPSSEQRRIVAKLDSLCSRTKAARDELARIPLLIEHYKQAILEKAFSGELTADWRAQEHLIPPKSGTLEQLIAVPVRNGLSVRGSDQPPGVRALRLSSLRTSMVTMNDVRYLPIDDERASRYRLAQGDVLVSRGNGTKAFVGLASLVPHHSEPTIFPDTAFRIRLKPDRARPEWFSIIWNASQVREQIEQAAKTTAGIWKISQGDLSGIILNIPDTREQVEIVRRVKAAMDWLNAVAAEQGQASYLLYHLDQGLLAKAFHGELVPQDPNDEPAEKLLERIRAPRSTEPKSRRGRRSRAAA